MLVTLGTILVLSLLLSQFGMVWFAKACRKRVLKTEHLILARDVHWDNLALSTFWLLKEVVKGISLVLESGTINTLVEVKLFPIYHIFQDLNLTRGNDVEYVSWSALSEEVGVLGKVTDRHTMNELKQWRLLKEREQLDISKEVNFMIEVPALHFRNNLIKSVVLDTCDSAVFQTLDWVHSSHQPFSPFHLTEYGPISDDLAFLVVSYFSFSRLAWRGSGIRYVIFSNVKVGWLLLLFGLITLVNRKLQTRLIHRLLP